MPPQPVGRSPEGGAQPRLRVAPEGTGDDDNGGVPIGIRYRPGLRQTLVRARVASRISNRVGVADTVAPLAAVPEMSGG